MKISSCKALSGVLFLLGTGGAYAQTVGEFEGHQDIGNVSAPGDAKFEGGKYEVTGSGEDIWNAADEFHYVYKKVTGSFKISGNISAYNDTGSNEWSKAGLMVRDNLTAGSPHFFVMVRGSDVQFDTQYRSVQDSGSSNLGVRGVDLQDGRVELVKVGDTFQSFFYNIQTNQYELQSTQTIDMNDNEVYVGLAVTSHEDGSYAIGEFENFKIELYPFETARSFPRNGFVAGQKLSGVTLTAKIRSGQTATVTLTETVPSGWAVSNVKASAGTASADASGKITWTLTAASGSPTLTYDVTPPANATTGAWSGTAVSGTTTLPIGGRSQLEAVPPLYKTGNVLAVGVWNDSNTSSDLAATAEVVDNNGAIYVQDSAATGGWPASTQFRYKVVFYDDGTGEEAPGWRDRGYDDSTWETSDAGFTIGHGGNAAENGETPLVASEETVYTRSVFDAKNYETIRELTIKVAADDEAVVWLNGFFIGNTAAGTSDRGETARDYVFDTTIAGGQGGLEGGSNPTTYSGGGTKIFTIPVDLVEGAPTSVLEWSVY